MDEREPIITIGIGVRGSGKSWRMKCDFLQYLAIHKNRKIIVFDTNKEKTFEDIPPIRSWDIPKLKRVATMRKVLPYNMTTGAPMSLDEKADMAFYLLNAVENGLLVLEDMNNYLVGTTQKKFISKLTTNRHTDLDIRLNLQSFGAITPRLWQNCNYLVMHYTNENLLNCKKKMPDFELYQIAQNIITDHYEAGDTRRFMWINVQCNKIVGISQNETSDTEPCTLRRVTYAELLRAYATYYDLPADSPKVEKRAQKKLGYILP